MQVASFLPSSTLSASTGAAPASATTTADSASLFAGGASGGAEASLDHSGEFESLLDSRNSGGQDTGSSANSFRSKSEGEPAPETRAPVTAETAVAEPHAPVYAPTILAASMAAAAVTPEPLVLEGEPVGEGAAGDAEPTVISCETGEFADALDEATPAATTPTRHAPIPATTKPDGTEKGGGRDTNSVEHDAAHLSAAAPNGPALGLHSANGTRRGENLPGGPALPVPAAAGEAPPAPVAPNAGPVFPLSPVGGYAGTPHPRQVALAAPGRFAPELQSGTRAPSVPLPAGPSAAELLSTPTPAESVTTVRTLTPARILAPTAVVGSPAFVAPESGTAVPPTNALSPTPGALPIRAIQPDAPEQQVFITNPETELPAAPTAPLAPSAPVRLAPFAVPLVEVKDPAPELAASADPTAAALGLAATTRQTVRLAPVALPAELAVDGKSGGTPLGLPTVADPAATETTLPETLPANPRVPEQTLPSPDASVVPQSSTPTPLPVRLAPLPVSDKNANAPTPSQPVEVIPAETTRLNAGEKVLPPPFTGEPGLMQPTDEAATEVRLDALEVKLAEVEVQPQDDARGVRRLSAWSNHRVHRAPGLELSGATPEGQGAPVADDAATEPATPPTTEPSLPVQSTVSTIRSLTPALATAWAEAAAAQQRPVARRDREAERTPAPETAESIFDSIPASAYEVETVTVDLTAVATVTTGATKSDAETAKRDGTPAADLRTPPASERAVSVASSASALATPREIPSATRGKNVPVGPRSERVETQKLSQVAEEKMVANAQVRLGTAVADKASTMPAHALPPAPIELLKDLLPAASVAAASGHASRSGSSEAPAAESTALRSYASATVKEVIAAAERIVPPRTTVELRLQAFEQENVRVQLVWREGTIHARFITETPELQAALTREWENSTGRFAEKGLKFGEATFEQRDHHQASSNSYSQEQHGRNRRQYADREFPEFALPSFLAAVTGRAASVPVDLPSMSGALHPMTNSQRGLRAWA